MAVLVKICGLSEPTALQSALRAGADMVGFVRFARSPRHVSLEAGETLSRLAHGRATRVLLTVDASDDELAGSVEAIAPDLLQFHGRESPERLAVLRARFGRPIMKAVGIGSSTDLEEARRFAPVVDRLLLDAKPPSGAILPGGNGATFDWRLLAGFGLDGSATLMLSGGLSPRNVGEAIEMTGIGAVDVSSGVEARPGVKSPALIEAFLAAARAARVEPNARRMSA
jgi:phosphoribosylanthranilate isomerase